MRHLLISIIFSLLILSGFAQDEPKVFTFVEVMPKFPGGQDELDSYLSKNLHYPESAVRDKVEGKVYVKFVVDSLGNITDVTIAKVVRNDLDEVAMKVVKEMPRWTPAFQGGKPVRVQFILPINFAINASKKK